MTEMQKIQCILYKLILIIDTLWLKVGDDFVSASMGVVCLEATAYSVVSDRFHVQSERGNLSSKWLKMIGNLPFPWKLLFRCQSHICVFQTIFFF